MRMFCQTGHLWICLQKIPLRIEHPADVKVCLLGIEHCSIRTAVCKFLQMVSVRKIFEDFFFFFRNCVLDQQSCTVAQFSVHSTTSFKIRIFERYSFRSLRTKNEDHHLGVCATAPPPCGMHILSTHHNHY